MSDDRRTDLIAAIQRDHREVEQLLTTVTSASGDARRRAFAELADKLKAHEAAEQKVVHPLTEQEGDPEEAQALRAEESAAAKALGKLEGLDADSPEFERAFEQLKADVLAHAQEEERDEHPRLQRETSADELERRGEQFEAEEARAAKG